VWLTPAERRGALALVVILLLGTGWDLWRSSRWAIRPAGHFAPLPAAADSSASQIGIAARPSDLPDPLRLTLDLNQATAAALDGLPGIGPVLAGRIVERRLRAGRYLHVDDLLEVPGIGPRLLDRLRPLVTVEADSLPLRGMQSANRRPLRRADSPSAPDSAFR
jgi:competence ComEA-like helix-hairpin-helix protein